MSRDLASLKDILVAAQHVQSYVSNVGWESFEQDEMRQDAVIRRLEIIGEATKRLSFEFRESYPDIAWKQMAGMRDILVHAYDQVILERVWETATTIVPGLIQQLQTLLDELMTSDSGDVSTPDTD